MLTSRRQSRHRLLSEEPFQLAFWPSASGEFLAIVASPDPVTGPVSDPQTTGPDLQPAHHSRPTARRPVKRMARHSAIGYCLPTEFFEKRYDSEALRSQ